MGPVGSPRVALNFPSKDHPRQALKFVYLLIYTNFDFCLLKWKDRWSKLISYGILMSKQEDNFWIIKLTVYFHFYQHPPFFCTAQILCIQNQRKIFFVSSEIKKNYKVMNNMKNNWVCRLKHSSSSSSPFSSSSSVAFWLTPGDACRTCSVPYYTWND